MPIAIKDILEVYLKRAMGSIPLIEGCVWKDDMVCMEYAEHRYTPFLSLDIDRKAGGIAAWVFISVGDEISLKITNEPNHGDWDEYESGPISIYDPDFEEKLYEHINTILGQAGLSGK